MRLLPLLEAESTQSAENCQKNVSICVNGNIWFTDYKACEARTLIQPQVGESVQLISCMNGDDEDPYPGDILCCPNTLGHFFQFSQMIMKSSTDCVVLCVCSDSRNITTAALLLGAHLVICEKMKPEDILEIFRPIRSRLLPLRDMDGSNRSELTMLDCLAALQRATELSWLDFRDTPSEAAIDLEEYIHYDCVANGQLHVVVPDKLIAFPSPIDLPDGRTWMDVDGARHFSPSYFAELLGEFNVAVVLCCARTGGDIAYDPAALAERGVATEVLTTDARSGRLLAAGDRMLTLARAVPGAIALHGAGGWEEGLLLSTYLIRLHAFPAREALAWARMTHPPARVANPRFIIHSSATPAAAANPDLPATN